MLSKQCAILCLAVLGVYGAGPGAWPQSTANEASLAGGLSRRMRTAIQFFDDGRDSEAMDGFMDILVHGNPSERNMANEYLNLITQRMNTPTSPPSSSVPLAAGAKEPAGISGSARGPGAAPIPSAARGKTSPAVAEEAPPRGTPQEGPSLNKETMRREIEAKDRAKARAYLGSLEKNSSIRVIMADQNNPRAIGLPTSALFGRETEFKKRSMSVLRDLSGLAYCLGGAQIAIFPEGTLTGESSILDMRRATGISSLLYSAGISPARVRVNLLQSQTDIPRCLSNFHGIIVVFIYNQS